MNGTEPVHIKTHPDEGGRCCPPALYARDTSQKFGIWGFAKIFSKNIVIPSKEIPFFGEAHQRFWAIIAKFGFFGVIRMARIAKFGYSGDPNNRITEYSVGDSVFFGFVPIIRKIGERRSKPNSVNPRPCQSVC
jgi:hypothetical protein